MKNAIEISGLSKYFRLDSAPLTFFNSLRKLLHKGTQIKEIWALRDINMTAEAGDRIGIVGSNGSGKTTLLRIIAGLYKSSSGNIRINGRVASFLQMGIGMERYLTVRENIFLFGAIMGLGRGEIRKKLDDIAAFAGIEEFVHCQLCDLSTGMVARLAFAIARHVDTDILLLDEMLASGDAGFRDKCYKILENYINTSKTFIMTSHESEMIRRICNKCLWLDKGVQMAFGPTDAVMAAYTAGKGS